MCLVFKQLLLIAQKNEKKTANTLKQQLSFTRSGITKG